jgi:hypothetical protein
MEMGLASADQQENQKSTFRHQFSCWRTEANPFDVSSLLDTQWCKSGSRSLEEGQLAEN